MNLCILLHHSLIQNRYLRSGNLTRNFWPIKSVKIAIAATFFGIIVQQYSLLNSSVARGGATTPHWPK